MILLVDPDHGFHERVADKLDSPLQTRTADGAVQARGAIAAQPGAFDVVFIGPNVDIDDAVALAAWVRDTSPEISVVVVSAVMTSDLLQQVLRAGVRDVLPAAFSQKQLAASLEHAAEAAHRERTRYDTHQHSGPSRGTVITVLSAKGGVGKSMIASNLAVLLAAEGAPVAVVDLDLEFGDLSVFFQLQPKHTIAEAAQYRDGLDDQALRGYLTPYGTGVQLLAAPQEPGLAETITADDVRTIIDLLSARFRTVIVDTPASFTDHVLAAIDASDVLPVVTAMDVPSIRSASMCLRTLEMLGVPKEKVRLILNRADSRVGLDVAEVERGLGIPVVTTVPSSREVPLSVNRGQPIAASDPRSPVTRALAAFATGLRGQPSAQIADAAPPAHPRRRILGRNR